MPRAAKKVQEPVQGEIQEVPPDGSERMPNGQFPPGVSGGGTEKVPAKVHREALARIAALEERLGFLEADPNYGEVTSAKMWLVWGQEAGADKGPEQKRLREWLVKDVKGYESRARELGELESGWVRTRDENKALRAEVEESRAELARALAYRDEVMDESDDGADRAADVVHELIVGTKGSK